MFETVVLATDGSESTGRAIEVGLDITARFGADLHAITVVEEGSNSEDDRGASDQGDAQAILDDLCQRIEQYESGTVQTSIETGDPAAEITSYADRVSADLITLGTRGRGSPHKYHLGSVAETIVYDCSIPVLTIRELNDAAME